MMDDLFNQFDRINECHDLSFSIPQKAGRGCFRSLCPRRGILLLLEEYQLNRELSVKTSNVTLPLSFSYCLSGRVDWFLNGRSEPFTTGKGQYELFFAETNGGVTIYCADEPIVIVNLMICPELMNIYLDTGPDHLAVDNVFGKPVSGEDILYKKRNIPQYMEQLLLQLMRSPCQCLSDKLYTVFPHFSLKTFLSFVSFVPSI